MNLEILALAAGRLGKARSVLLHLQVCRPLVRAWPAPSITSVRQANPPPVKFRIATGTAPPPGVSPSCESLTCAVKNFCAASQPSATQVPHCDRYRSTSRCVALLCQLGLSPSRTSVRQANPPPVKFLIATAAIEDGNAPCPKANALVASY